MRLLIALLPLLIWAEPLRPRLEDGRLGVDRPAFNFLVGKPLERLKNGLSVTYDFQLQVFDGPKPVGRSLRRFVLSYDLWEETFSAVALAPAGGRNPVESVSRLSAEALTGWCFDRVLLPVSPLPGGKPLRLELDIRGPAAKLPNPLRPHGVVDLAVLVEIFSRPPDPRDTAFHFKSDSFTLAQLGRP